MESERLVIGRRRYVLAVLIAAIAFAEVSKDCLFSRDLGDWLGFWQLVYAGAIACLPFLLARTFPKAASFHIQWLPGLRRHWVWFAGMLFLLLGVDVLLGAVGAYSEGNPFSPPFIALVVPATMGKLRILAFYFAGPLSEEIFCRAFVLAQLQKLAVSGVAVFIQSLIFAGMHLANYGLTSRGLTTAAVAFAFAMIAGAWRIRLRSLLPLVLAHILLAAFINCNRPERLYHQDKGTTDAAFAAYSDAIRLDPTDPIRYWRRGFAYQQTGAYDKAIADYTEAILLDPYVAELHSNRGQAYASKREYEKAINDFNEAIRLKPDLSEFYYNRGNSYLKKCEYKKAIADFSAIIRLDSSDAFAFCDRAAAYGENGEYVKAIADYTEAIRLDPRFAGAYYGRGLAYYRKGSKANAEADFAQARNSATRASKVVRRRWGSEEDGGRDSRRRIRIGQRHGGPARSDRLPKKTPSI